MKQEQTTSREFATDRVKELSLSSSRMDKRLKRLPTQVDSEGLGPQKIYLPDFNFLIGNIS